jgi:mRNA-degrading endonuclease toxin of MazEF toxin-antitoxin module
MATTKRINPDIREQFAELVVSSTTFQAGGIYLTNDQNVLFPSRPKDKIKDKPRMGVVLGKREQLEDPLYPTVFFIPITTSLVESPQCFPVKAGTGNLNEDSLIKAGMIQPILKADILHKIGQMDGEILDQLKAQVFVNLGLDEDDQE